MPNFKYKARTSRGDLMEGIVEAGDSAAAAVQLHNGGLTPVELESVPGGARASGKGLLHDLLPPRKPEMAELILFCRQMYTLMRAGVPIVRGMQSLLESATNPRLIEILEVARSDIESGRELSTALARYPEAFSPLFVNMVRVGENTGQLDEAFLRIGQYLELDMATRERVKAAIRYPSFVLATIAGAIVVINVFVIPAFGKVFERAQTELPLPTRILIGVSDCFLAYGPHMAVALAALALGWSQYLRTESGRYRWDKFKLRLPLVGSIIHRATLGRFARAFSIASRAGVPLIQTLSLVAKTLDNEYVGDRILQMRNGIERGDTLGRTAAGTTLFTPLVLQMIAIGEETGAVDDLLEEVAGFYEREVENDLRNLSANIEPILIGVVSVMVLGLALGVFLPMWDLAAGAAR